MRMQMRAHLGPDVAVVRLVLGDQRRVIFQVKGKACLLYTSDAADE